MFPRKFKSMRLALLGFSILALVAILFFRDREPNYQGRSLSAWLDDSASRDDEARALAQDVLKHAGPSAVPFLVKEFGYLDAPWKYRMLYRVALYSPFKIDWRRKGDRVAAALDTLKALGTNSASAIPVFVKSMNRNPFAGAFCLSAVGTAARDHPATKRAIPILIDQLGDNEPDLRDAVRGALYAIGPSALPALTLALTNQNPTVRTRTAALIALIGTADTAVPQLLPLLEDPNADVRKTVAEELGRFPDQAALTGPQLLPLLQDSEPIVRIGAAGALAQIGFKEDEAQRAVLAVLNATTNEMRVNVVIALRHFKHNAPGVVRTLLNEVTNSYVRVENIRLAAEHDPQNRERLGGLKWMEGYFRVNAVRSLRELLPAARELAPEAIPILLKAVDDDEDWVRGPAFQAIGQLGASARWVVPRLLDMIQSGDGTASVEAIHALVQIAPEDEQVTKVLLAALQESPIAVRAAAAKALGFGKASDLVKANLIRAAADHRHEVRLAAVQSLGTFVPLSDAAKAALASAKQDSFPSIRLAAEQALKAGNLETAVVK